MPDARNGPPLEILLFGVTGDFRGASRLLVVCRCLSGAFRERIFTDDFWCAIRSIPEVVERARPAHPIPNSSRFL